MLGVLFVIFFMLRIHWGMFKVLWHVFHFLVFWRLLGVYLGIFGVL